MQGKIKYIALWDISQSHKISPADVSQILTFYHEAFYHEALEHDEQPRL